MDSIAAPYSIVAPQPATRQKPNDQRPTRRAAPARSRSAAAATAKTATKAMLDVHVRFAITDDTEEVVIQMIDPESGDVIREVPSEESRQIAAEMAAYLERGRQARARSSGHDAA